jgi:hypothetical protein
MDFVLPGSRELWRRVEVSGFFRAAGRRGARSDIQDILDGAVAILLLEI